MKMMEMESDTRNLQDEYKGLSNAQVCQELARKRTALEVAIENVEHDFNVGTIVRSANNFNAAKVHIIGVGNIIDVVRCVRINILRLYIGRRWRILLKIREHAVGSW